LKANCTRLKNADSMGVFAFPEKSFPSAQRRMRRLRRACENARSMVTTPKCGRFGALASLNGFAVFFVVL
jgi:hypothetical protein